MKLRGLAGAGLALATAGVLVAWLSARGDGGPPAGGAALARASAWAVDLPRPVLSVNTRSTAATAAPPTAPGPAPQAAAASRAVPITVAAPQKMLVGEMSDLVIGLGADAGVSEVSFTVQFDANVLQVRAATEGDWAARAGAVARFAADISSTEDSVHIRSYVPAARSGIAGSSVALVQFQAVAPGSTSVILTDLVVKNGAGQAVPLLVSASNLQITVDSLPPRPDARR